MNQYEVVNGTSYEVGTDKRVIDVLETARLRRERVRIFYGDSDTGRSWNEEYDVMGRVSRSMGDAKIPILIPNSRSVGGGAIITKSIVRIDFIAQKFTMYQHTKFHVTPMYVADRTEFEEVEAGDLRFQVREFSTEDTVIAQFTTREKAERYIAFLRGERYSK